MRLIVSVPLAPGACRLRLRDNHPIGDRERTGQAARHASISSLSRTLVPVSRNTVLPQSLRQNQFKGNPRSLP